MLRILAEALTFDDVSLVPAHSSVLPKDVRLATQLTRNIRINLPIVSAAMDTVTEARLAIAMAQLGGIGILHKNMSAAEQAAHVAMVKNFEAGVIREPFTVGPDTTIGEVLKLTRARNISGVPVVEREVPGPGQTRYLARVIGYGSVAAGTRRAVLSLIDISRLHDAERLQRLIDSLPEHVALIDRNGTIRQVNRAWTDFAERNGGDASRTGVGSNYLGALAHSDAPGAGELLLGVQQVLAGTRQTLRQTYPCHAPDEERWFVLHVSRLAGETDDRERGAVVTHLEVTPWMQGRTVAIEDVQEDPHA